MFFHRTNFRYLASVLVVLFAVFTTSCMNSIDQMLEDYNSNFIKAHKLPIEPGDEGFDESDLLLEEYTVATDASLTINAPKTCYTYTWEIYKVEFLSESVGGYWIEDAKKVLISFPGKYSLTDQTLSFAIKEVSDFVPGTYEIRLAVVGRNGVRYKDAATLVIYKPFYVYND